jgi:hypothetical protein
MRRRPPAAAAGGGGEASFRADISHLLQLRLIRLANNSQVH